MDWKIVIYEKELTHVVRTLFLSNGDVVYTNKLSVAVSCKQLLVEINKDDLDQQAGVTCGLCQFFLYIPILYSL